jgi:predicted nucleotidyltransferase
MLDIADDNAEVVALCRRLGVVRLDLFGSATRDELKPGSDVDVLVRFDRARGDLFARFFDLKEGLEAILGRPVDLVVEDAIRNPYFRHAVEQSRRNVFAA